MMFSAASTESPTASQTNSEFGFEYIYIYIYIFDGIVREYFDHNIKKNSYLIF